VVWSARQCVSRLVTSALRRCLFRHYLRRVHHARRNSGTAEAAVKKTPPGRHPPGGVRRDFSIGLADVGDKLAARTGFAIGTARTEVAGGAGRAVWAAAAVGRSVTALAAGATRAARAAGTTLAAGAFECGEVDLIDLGRDTTFEDEDAAVAAATSTRTLLTVLAGLAGAAGTTAVRAIEQVVGGVGSGAAGGTGRARATDATRLAVLTEGSIFRTPLPTSLPFRITRPPALPARPVIPGAAAIVSMSGDSNETIWPRCDQMR